MFLKLVSIIFTGVEGLIDAIGVWEFEWDVEQEGVPKVSEIGNFLHPEVWTCEKAFFGDVEKYMCFKRRSFCSDLGTIKESKITRCYPNIQTVNLIDCQQTMNFH